VRYFVLLYTPASQRAALGALLAIADELAAGLARELDHGVAHLRLQWWADELARLAQGSPRHPWLTTLPAPGPLWPDLSPLLQAASLDLATHRLAARHEQQLACALFIAAAALLGVPAEQLQPPDSALRADLFLLGRCVSTLESAATGAGWARAQSPERIGELAARQRRGALPPAAHQRALTPLLVWVALTLQHWRRTTQRRTHHAAAESATMPELRQPGRFDGLWDNCIAWRAARSAQRRRFRIAIA
jgi:hypothetical protein